MAPDNPNSCCTTESIKTPLDWSRDGKFLLFTQRGERYRQLGLWVLPMEGDRKPIPYLVTALQ